VTTGRIRLNAFDRAHARLRADLDAAWARVSASGWYVGGPEVEAFEARFAAFTGVRNAVGVANGTDAIALALRALGVGAGDRVIVPALSAYPTTVGVVQAGATPLFVDVGEDGLIAPSAVERALGATPSVRAVVCVHLYGVCADAPALRALVGRRGVALVEDAAQAHLATRAGGGPGSWGDAAAWSFYPTKNLGAFGDAGAVTTADDAVAARLRRLRNYGQENRYEHVEVGFTSRLDPLQAAILMVKTAALEIETQRRREIGARYDRAFSDVGGALRPLPIPAGCVPNRHLYPVLVASAGDRPAFQAHLDARGVETLIHYPIAMPDQRASDPAWSAGEAFPVARSICERVVSLPVHPDLTDDEVERVTAAVLTWAGASLSARGPA
jgi:dTDP-4-amino-4,6-dideoxygalactose transaminase